MNRAAALALMGGGDQAKFVAGSIAAASGGSATVSFSGMAAGNLAIIFAASTFSVASTPSGWTAISLPVDASGFSQAVFWKILSSGDISTGTLTIGANVQGLVIVAYTNATSVALKSSTSNSGSTIVLPAFSLSSTSAGALFFILDSGAGSYAPPALGGLVTREGPSLAANFYIAGYDFTTPSDYPEAALTWTGFDTVGPQDGYVLELLQ